MVTIFFPLPTRVTPCIHSGQREIWSWNQKPDGGAADTLGMIDSVISKGLLGIQEGLKHANDDAVRVIRAFSTESEEDPVSPLLDLQFDKHQVQASAKVVKVGSEMIGSILDILG